MASKQVFFGIVLVVLFSLFATAQNESYSTVSPSQPFASSETSSTSSSGGFAQPMQVSPSVQQMVPQAVSSGFGAPSDFGPMEECLANKCTNLPPETAYSDCKNKCYEENKQFIDEGSNGFNNVPQPMQVRQPQQPMQPSFGGGQGGSSMPADAISRCVEKNCKTGSSNYADCKQNCVDILSDYEQSINEDNSRGGFSQDFGINIPVQSTRQSVNNLEEKQKQIMENILSKQGGPGGCKSLEKCEEYCNQPDNSKACFEWAQKNLPQELKQSVVKPQMAVQQVPSGFDYQGFGQFQDIPVEEIVLGKLGEMIFSKYDESDLASKCSDQPKLVELAMSFIDETTDLASLCEPIKDGLAKVSESEQMCSQMQGGNQRIDYPNSESFAITCPPNEASYIEFCKKQLDADFDRRISETADNAKYNCEEDWIRNKYDFLQRCNNPERTEPSCDKQAYVNQCISREQSNQQNQVMPPQENQQNQYDPQQKYPQGSIEDCVARTCPQSNSPDYPACKQRCAEQSKTGQSQPPGQWVATTQPQSTFVCPSFQMPSQDWFNNCKNSGGQVLDLTDDRGCKLPPKCSIGLMLPVNPPSPTPFVSTQPSTQTPYATPVTITTPAPTAASTEVPSSTPAPTLAPTASTTPTPTPVSTTPTPTPVSTPAPTPFVNQSGFPLGLLTGWIVETQVSGGGQGYSATDRCARDAERMFSDKNFLQNCRQMTEDGFTYSNPWNAGPADYCSKETFITACSKARTVQDTNQMRKQQADSGELCALRAKRELRNFQQFCKDSTRGKDDCLKQTNRGKEFLQKQLDKCVSVATKGGIKAALEKKVTEFCKVSRYRTKMITADVSQITGSEVIPVIIAAAEDISSADEGKLKALVKIDAFFTIASLRIYSGKIPADKFNELKALPFVQDAKLDHIARSIAASNVVQRQLAGGVTIGRELTALELTRQLANDEVKPIISYEQQRLMNVTENLEQLKAKEGAGNPVYQVQWLLGFAQDNEKQLSQDFNVEGARMNETVANLEKLASQVDDLAVRASLMEQITSLKVQQQNLQTNAVNKAKFSQGLLGMIRSALPFGG